MQPLSSLLAVRSNNCVYKLWYTYNYIIKHNDCTKNDRH